MESAKLAHAGAVPDLLEAVVLKASHDKRVFCVAAWMHVAVKADE
jgi:hypothetical protein